VLSSDDPIRVFQDFATLDQLSGGRAEIMVGRGSFTESFPLFGQDLSDYDELFSENLDLLLKVRGQDRITWSGRHRPSIDDRAVYPRPLQDPIPVWIAVGGTAQSVVRAAKLGLPMALAIIGGAPARFRHVVDLYRETAEEAGYDSASLPISINSHGFLADDAAAAEIAFPPFAETMTRIGRERGWPPTTRAQFDAESTLRGAMFLGSPQQIIEKILYQHEIFRHQRFLIQLTVGPMPHADVMRAIELLGTEVAPVVRRELGVAASGLGVAELEGDVHP
jgi:alkanesulfonate monooxygenase SsuD/methylene tetrahydromethanopterin reductase-like flavin-dependent oxidoreductase (luciferase family)